MEDQLRYLKGGSFHSRRYKCVYLEYEMALINFKIDDRSFRICRNI